MSKKCTECGNIVDDNIRFCSKCGSSDFQNLTQTESMQNGAIYPSPKKVKKGLRGWQIALIIVAAAVVLSLIIVLASGSSSNDYVPKPNSVITDTTPNHTQEEQTIQDQTANQEETPATEPAPADIAYDLFQLSDAIYAWQRYENDKTVCNGGGEFFVEAEKYLNCVGYQDIMAISCCSTIHEAKMHVGKYMIPELYADFPDNIYAEYRGLLFVALEGPWIQYNNYNITLDESQVTRTAYNAVSVTTSHEVEGRFKCATRFDFEYRDGTYKIAKVTDLQ